MRRYLCLLILPLLVITSTAIEEPDSDDLPDLSDVPPHAQPFAFGETFLEDDWEIFSVYEDDFQIIAAWRDDDGAVISSTRYEFDDDRARELYLNDREENYEIILAFYEPYALQRTCASETTSDIILDEHNATLDDTKYELRHYWWREGETVLWVFGLLFPSDQLLEMNELSATFQPELISCVLLEDE